MILARGRIYDSAVQGELLDRLEQEINETRASGRLLSETVIAAVEKLRDQILEGKFAVQIDELARSGAQGTENVKEQIAQVLELLRREHLEYKMRTELGAGAECAGSSVIYGEYMTAPALRQRSLRVVTYPLGTLFHIAAGNVDGLPVYSVLEGLLTGNVNILKLPQADRGLSIEILTALLDIEPRIAPYVYVFDTPSEDVAAMKRMADISDGIVVWGGDAVVQAVRQMAKPGTRLIEWGHKLGFAYISGYEEKERELAALAEHIVKTQQLLCSSCQTIFIDTEDMTDVFAFCEEFLTYLQAATEQNGQGSVGTRAEIALRRYSDTIEKALTEVSGAESGTMEAYGEGKTVGSSARLGSGKAAESEAEKTIGLREVEKAETKAYYGKGCSLTAMTDSELELSYMFGNCLVKRLPKNKIFESLRGQKGYLQSVGLLCAAERRKELTDILAACGLVRIMRAGHQSDSFVGEAHDGEYPLQRYVRIVNVEL